TPGLRVKMRVEWRREDPPTRQRFNREEQYVGDQVERDRSDERLPSSVQVGDGEKTRTAHQRPEGSNEAAVYLGERLDQLFEQATKGEIARAQGPFAAGRTVGRGDGDETGRARPRLGRDHVGV